MVDSYREGRKGDLKFLKNRMKTAKAAHQAIRQRHHQAWKANHEKVHKQLPGPVGVSGVDPQASTIQLWPPFSVANTVLPIQVRKKKQYLFLTYRYGITCYGVSRSGILN